MVKRQNWLKPVFSALKLVALLLLGTQLVASAFMDDTLYRVANGPRIEIKPSMPIIFFEAQSPSNKVLTCSTLGDKPGMFSRLRWSGPNRHDNWEELSKRHKITEDTWNGNSLELEFRNPSVDDSGVYYCHGTYQSSDVYNASITVRVYNAIKLDNCPERQFVVDGERNQKITCHITGDQPRVMFWKDNEVIEKHGNRYKWDNDGDLVIEGTADKSDAGTYRVQVTGDITGERRNQLIRVEVHSKPEILPFNGTLLENETEFAGVEGEPAELKCQVAGYPRPLVYWLDPKLRNLTSVGGYIVNPERGQLIINKVNRVDDHGDFICKAYNSVGETSRKVSMAVHVRPAIISFENKTIDEGSDVTFECRSTGDPRPNITIRKHGINQAPYRFGDGMVRDMNLEPEGGGSNVWVYRLRITANRTNFGIHYCNATNKAGSAERIGQLTVNHKPDLSQTPPEQFIKLGKRYAITCHIKAYPEPTVTWLNEHTQVINVESNVKTSPDGQTHIVTMMPPTNIQGSYSRYVCQAKNKMGNSEVVIIPRYTTPPGPVIATVLERSPTTVKLQLQVPNDGGDRIKSFVYRLDGKTLDIHNPIYSFRRDIQNETYIDASLNPNVPYVIRNLLPYYVYTFVVRAVNDVGVGDEQALHFETTRPTRPEPPLIIKPAVVSSQQPVSGTPSEYNNGYLLKWGPPDLDNGDPITKYIIKFNKIDTDSLDTNVDDGQVRVIEQMNERPMHARIGPLETNRRYKIQMQARNKYGDSDPTYIIIYTSPDRPLMPEFDALALTWLVEPSASVLFGLLALGIILLITIDLIFCLCFQIGVSHFIRSWCCPAKANSVISDKTYT